MIVDSSGGLASRRERHIGRMQAYLDAFSICRAVTARFSNVSAPQEAASAEEWRAFARGAVSAFEDLSARMTELRRQIQEETAVLSQDLRAEREGRFGQSADGLNPRKSPHNAAFDWLATWLCQHTRRSGDG